jgi:hypothetical protein
LSLAGLDPAQALHGPRCHRCGGDRLRRARARRGLRRLLRRATGWDRYACRSCGHRGWARGPVPSRSGPASSPGRGPGPVPGPAPEAGTGRIDTPTGRRLERRDHRLRRRLRVRAVLAVVASLGLGLLAAWSLQHCGVPPPPLE